MEGLLRGSERKAEDRPLSRDALAPHAPAVATHDALHGGEPESAPGELLPGMEPLEGLENYSVVSVVEADPIRNLSTTMGHSTGLIREQCPVW